MNFNPIGDKLSVSALGGLELYLQELQLGACAIQSLPDGLLVGMDRLVSLHLWANRISHIPTSFFRAAPQLHELLLWGNEIAEVNQDTFAGLWKLRKLDLDRNRITTLDKEAFRHLSQLRVLLLKFKAASNATIAIDDHVASVSTVSGSVCISIRQMAPSQFSMRPLLHYCSCFLCFRSMNRRRWYNVFRCRARCLSVMVSFAPFALCRNCRYAGKKFAS